MFKALVLAAAVLATVTLAAPGAISNCISDCSGVANGDYHSCNGCKVYATCSNGLLYDNRDCPADLVWDDSMKRCEWTSDTCNRRSNCLSDCVGIADGDYQSCAGCDVYVTCSNGLTYDKRPCPASLVWDDNMKRCEWASSTCTSAASDPQLEQRDLDGEDVLGDDDGEFCQNGGRIANCVDDCTGMEDGNHPSCNGCGGFTTCANGLVYEMDCPAGLVWDDQVKQCQYTTASCYCVGDSGTCSADSTGDACVSDCAGLADGDYQSCKGCDIYLTCSNQVAYDFRPCPSDLLWDESVKECRYSSATCQCPDEYEEKREMTDDEEILNSLSTGGGCVRDCSNQRNGDYQSCAGCNVYVTCSNGLTYDNRPCPANLVWDDNRKRCEWKSPTCS